MGVEHCKAAGELLCKRDGRCAYATSAENQSVFGGLTSDGRKGGPHWSTTEWTLYQQKMEQLITEDECGDPEDTIHVLHKKHGTGELHEGRDEDFMLLPSQS